MTQGGILIVEDSDTQALKLEALLMRTNTMVNRAATAEAAIAHLHHHRPDLAIVDFHLPGMSGADLCRFIRRHSDSQELALLMLTDDAQSDVERHGFESGADDYVTKAADDEIILAKVEALLRRRHERSVLSPTQKPLFALQSILIVDDSPTYRLFLEDQLHEEGFDVIGAEGGAAALSIIEARNEAQLRVDEPRQSPIDCVVLDLVMPEMDGIELCRRLNDIRRRDRLSFPILMVTSHDSKEEMMRALEAGADDFVTKSKDTVILRARIRALLRRKMLHEEHGRILAEFRNKELEVVQARAEQKAAEARAHLAEELEKANADLKQTQVQLVQSAKMASLGALVAGVAHEINNPLAFSLGHLRTVAGLLDALSANLETALSDEGRRRVEKASLRARAAIDGLARVTELIAKLRTFSHLDQGEFKLADIKEGVEAAIPLIRHRLGDSVKLVTRYAGDNRLYCAPGMINQALINLLANAIDAMDGRAGEIALATSRTEEWFTLSVADQGPGIDEAALGRLFEPFFTTKDVGQGSGLGLAITHGIVKRHRGRIEARNKEEGGAEFIIHIPTNLPEQSQAETEAA
ncbi:MAG: response regulator [Amphiplicatus sp.]